MWPREYARQILAQRTVEERRAALQNVPPEWQALVRKHVENAWNLANRNQAPQTEGNTNG